MVKDHTFALFKFWDPSLNPNQVGAGQICPTNQGSDHYHDKKDYMFIKVLRIPIFLKYLFGETIFFMYMKVQLNIHISGISENELC